MGCIARLGCLVVLVVGCVFGYLTRDTWMPKRLRTTVVATPTSTGWTPLDPAGADHARVALEKLGDKTGPAFQTVPVSDLASYAMTELSKQVPTSVDSIATRTSGDTVFLRANVRIADLGGGASLGPLASMLGDRETVQVAGTMHVVEPGHAELQVENVKIRNLSIPSGMIPELLRRIGHGTHAGSSRNSIAFPVPKSLGDVRVARGNATLYKSGQ